MSFLATLKQQARKGGDAHAERASECFFLIACRADHSDNDVPIWMSDAPIAQADINEEAEPTLRCKAHLDRKLFAQPTPIVFHVFLLDSEGTPPRPLDEWQPAELGGGYAAWRQQSKRLRSNQRWFK